MKEIIAKKRVPYAGRYREVGEVFEAKDKHAHVLVTIGKCEYAPVKQKAPARRRGRPPNTAKSIASDLSAVPNDSAQEAKKLSEQDGE